MKIQLSKFICIHLFGIEITLQNECDHVNAKEVFIEKNSKLFIKLLYFLPNLSERKI